jgi:hypothetical protein
MAFNEPSFLLVIGPENKQKIIDILIEIELKENKSTISSKYSTISGDLFLFIARQLTFDRENLKIDKSIIIQVKIQKIFTLLL